MKSTFQQVLPAAALLLVLTTAVIYIVADHSASTVTSSEVSSAASQAETTSTSADHAGSLPSAWTNPLEENSPLSGKVLINEVMATNKTGLFDEDAGSSDWIELRNTSSETVDLTGCFLSADSDRPFLWELSPMKLQPGEYRIIFASGKDRPGERPHTNFTIPRNQVDLSFRDPSGRLIDRITISQNRPDVSYGRSADHPADWLYFTQPSPGRQNGSGGHASLRMSADAAALVINEIMSTNTGTLKDRDGEYSDWIEIKNPGDSPVSLEGFGLSDGGDPAGRWIFPNLTIQPGETLVVFASGKNKCDPSAPLHTDFSLSAAGEPVILYDPFGGAIDSVRFGRLGDNISYGRAQDNSRWLYFDKATPGADNGSDGFLGYTDSPVFSIESGFYPSAQTIQISSTQPGAQIRYTLDGSEPSAQSGLYAGPIEITGTAVVRAAAFLDGYRPGRISTATYFIGVSHTLPVVSLVLDPTDFDDPTDGIYSKGPNASSQFPYFGANFHGDKEPPTSFQLFEPDGRPGFQMDVGIQIFGGWTRAYDQKSLAIFARSKYESDVMDYPFLTNKSLSEFKHLILRTAGQDVYRSKIRDILATRLMAETSLDFQGYRFVVLYINGRYWGVYSIREKVNRTFIANNHGIDDLETIDILSGNGSVLDGESTHYKALLAFIKTHDLAGSESYGYVKSAMDVENYMDYIIMMMYAANVDSGNIRFWRERADDGQWRWFVYDMDLGFGSGATVTHDTVWFMIDPAGTGAGGAFSTRLINSLLKNDEFRHQFIERFAYHLKNTFDPDRVIAIIDELSAEIEPEMAMNVERWDRPASVLEWRQSVEFLRDFARRRPAVIRDHLRQHFSLSAEEAALFQ